MRAQLSLFVMLVAASPAMAQNREDFDAAAALALQVAIQPTSPRLPATLTLAEAKEFARSRRAPVLVRVGGLDCAALCAKLRPDFASCHADELAGERSPHLRLLLADAEGTLWLSGERWASIPHEAEVRQAAAEMKRQIDAPPQRAPACPRGNCPRR